MMKSERLTPEGKMTAKVKEIFESIQGEGVLIGEKQLFIRFAGCNLNCKYCDTDGNVHFELNGEELFDKIKGSNADFISLTGGEPLLYADFIQSFLAKYKKFLKKGIYLETNGTLFNELKKVVNLIDIIAMDIKIESATGEKNNFDLNEEFLKVAPDKTFVKVVFTKEIKDDEINSILNLAKKYSIQIVLQPKTPLEERTPYLEIYEKFYSKYKNVKLIPQTHKILGLE